MTGTCGCLAPACPFLRVVWHDLRIAGRRLGALVVAAAVAAAVVASSASGALFFLFAPTSAKPGDRVTVRLGGTPAGFTLAERMRPLQRPIRVYLVPNAVAQEVRTRFDPRLHFVGLLVPDRNVRGVLEFSVPPLDTGLYAIAAWCPGCARSSFGRTFFTLPISRVSRFRRQLGLRVTMPPATESCTVTVPRGPDGSYGNGLLATVLAPDGRLVAAREPGGTLFAKPRWTPRPGLDGSGPGGLAVRGERLDAPAPPAVVRRVSWGSGSGPNARGGWASALSFPTEGCWRISGRVRDVTLSFVVRVLAG